MWEAIELGDDDLLWASVNFIGGIAGERQTACGAVSAAVVYLGFRHRVLMSDKESANNARITARDEARYIVTHFKKQFGTITCSNLLDIDFSDTEAVRYFLDSGQWYKKCNSFVTFVIEKLYELEC